MSDSVPTIVLVEDDKQIRRFVRAALEAEGCHVFEADTVRQGLVEAGTRKPDMVILDLGLPVQYSVFEVPDRNYRDVLAVLDAEAKPADAVRIYRLCRRCGDRVEVVGAGVAPANEPAPPAVIEVPPGAQERAGL